MVSRIRQLCEENNMSFLALETAIGKPPGTIRRWDDNRPSIDVVKAVADYFGVSLDYLMTGKSSAEVTDDDLKFALFGGSDDVTDEMYDEVKRFARFIKLQRGEK